MIKVRFDRYSAPNVEPKTKEVAQSGIEWYKKNSGSQYSPSAGLGWTEKCSEAGTTTRSTRRVA